MLKRGREEEDGGGSSGVRDYGRRDDGPPRRAPPSRGPPLTVEQELAQRLLTPVSGAQNVTQAGAMLLDRMSEPLSTSRDATIDVVVMSLALLPSKVELLASFVMNARIRDAELAATIVRKLATLTTQGAQSGDLVLVRGCLVAAATLMRHGLVASAVVIAMLGRALRSAASLPLPQLRYLFVAVCAATMHAGEALFAVAAADLDALVRDIERFASTHQDALTERPAAFRLPRGTAGGKLAERSICLEAAAAVAAAAHASWRLQSVGAIPPGALEAPPLPFEADVAIGPTSGAPPMVATFLCFQASPTGPALACHDQWALRDMYGAALANYAINHTLCARLIPESPYFVEALFDAAMQLDGAAHPRLYLAVVLSDICRAGSILPRFFGSVAHDLFTFADDFDPIALCHAAEFMAIHLSNFEFKWPWESTWRAVAAGTASAAQRFFVLEVLAHCVRLSSIERIRAELPPAFQALLPEPLAVVFPYASPTPEAAAVVEALHRDLSRKEDAATLRAPLSAAAVQLNGPSEAAILAASLLFVARASPSHMLHWTQHYHGLLAATLADERAQREAVAAVLSTCIAHPLLLETVLEKWLVMCVVSPRAILDVLFERRALAERLAGAALLHIVSDVLAKMRERLDAIAGLPADVRAAKHAQAAREYADACIVICNGLERLDVAVQGEMPSLGATSGFFRALRKRVILLVRTASSLRVRALMRAAWQDAEACGESREAVGGFRASVSAQ